MSVTPKYSYLFLTAIALALFIDTKQRDTVVTMDTSFPNQSQDCSVAKDTVLDLDLADDERQVEGKPRFRNSFSHSCMQKFKKCMRSKSACDRT